MMNKSVMLLWPEKIKEGERLENNLGFIETIYLVEDFDEGQYVSTSYFSRHNRRFEIHKTYLVNGGDVKPICEHKKELSKVLTYFTSKELVDKFKLKPAQSN